jgi:hypothetical protein
MPGRRCSRPVRALPAIIDGGGGATMPLGHIPGPFVTPPDRFDRSPRSLADAKPAEDRAEQIVGREGARDFAKRFVRSAQFLGDELERRVAGSGM